MSDYQIGDLIEATINVSSVEKARIRAAYVPDGEDDSLPFRRLIPNVDPREQWFGLDELSDIVRLVAVPKVTRAQVFDILYPDGTLPAEDQRESKIDTILALFGQGSR